MKCFAKTFSVLFLLGLAGVATLPLTLGSLLENPPPELATFSDMELIVLSLINPLVMLAVATAAGTVLAPRTGFTSHIASRLNERAPLWPPLRREAAAALAGGAAVALALIVVDVAFAVRIEERIPAMLIAGMLYGGLTEELTLRWGC